MKKLVYLTLAAALLLGGCKKAEEETTGGIQGIVTDYDTGEPVQTAEVTLTPNGKTAVTGSDGYYKCADLDVGEYTVQVSKSGYQTNVKHVAVYQGSDAKCDVVLRRGTSFLAVSKTAINFGTSDSNNAVFEIINNGQATLEWTITENCEWIVSVVPAQGTLPANGKTSVTVSIDRAKTPQDNKEHTYDLIINSNSGGAAVTVSVNGENGGNGNDDGGGSGGGAPTAGLMVYYPFDDGSADDATDNDLDASLIGSPDFVTETQSGRGKALFLNKTKSQYMNIPSNPFLNKTTYTIAFWIKDFGTGVLFTAVGTDYRRSNYPRMVCTSDGKFRVYTGYDNYDNTPAFDYGVSDIRDGKWHHIAVTCVRGTDQYYTSIFTNMLYIDGRLKDQNETSGNFSGTCTKVQFGGYAGYDEGNDTSLKVDDVRFYDRALNANEVKAIYDAKQ